MVELTEILCLGDNKEFAELLNRLKEGNHISVDVVVLKKQLVLFESYNNPSNVPHLFATNERVHSFNNTVNIMVGLCT
jgi:hypothetical protein